MTYTPDYPLEPPPEAYDYDYEPPEDYEPEPFVVAPDQPSLPGLEPPVEQDDWTWLEARFVGLEQVNIEGELTGYEVGCVDLYANTRTGDLGGSFLRVQAFDPDERDRAEDLFNRLNGYAYDRDLAAHELPDLAEKAAAKIAAREGGEPPEWCGLTPDEYKLFERELGLVQEVEPDMPPEHAQADLLRTACELGGVEADVEVTELHPAAQALTGIGLSARDFDPDRDAPPFYDETTQTAYWIGIYQPDPEDRETCVASILSLTRDPDSGVYEAQLAPCVTGNWDKTFEASDYLIHIAERCDDIERVFEAAEGMAIAGDQRQTWQHERGVALEPGSAQVVGEYVTQQWEVDL